MFYVKGNEEDTVEVGTQWWFPNLCDTEGSDVDGVDSIDYFRNHYDILSFFLEVYLGT